MVGYAMQELLGMTHHGQHRKAGFDDPALIAGSLGVSGVPAIYGGIVHKSYCQAARHWYPGRRRTRV